MKTNIKGICVDDFLKDIEKPGTVEEMEIYYISIMESINESKELTKLAKLRTGRLKKFFEEYAPLLKFVQSEYVSKDAICNIVLGNQQYDGLINEKDKNKVRHIEISMYHDGHAAYKDAQELNARGQTEVRVGDLDENLDAYISGFAKCVRDKREKGYQDTEILFVIDTESIAFLLYDFNKNELIERAKQKILNEFGTSNDAYLLICKCDKVFEESIIIKI